MRINEIFYSLQGEGYWTGIPAVFVRFSGCNLRCPFCDTHHHDAIEMTEDEIVDRICRYASRHIIFTGGEPTLQLTKSLVDHLHKLDKFLHIETNGSVVLPDGIDVALDWITVSPKDAPLRIQRIDELKLLFHGQGTDIAKYEGLEIRRPECRFLQPCDVGDPDNNTRILNETIAYIKLHPQWRLSLQTHKILRIP